MEEKDNPMYRVACLFRGGMIWFNFFASGFDHIVHAGRAAGEVVAFLFRERGVMQHKADQSCNGNMGTRSRSSIHIALTPY